MVKTVSGTFGFIDRSGKIVVPAIYKKVGRFGEVYKGLSRVANVGDKYGFIDSSGKEVVPAIYSKDDIKNYFHNIYMRHKGELVKSNTTKALPNSKRINAFVYPAIITFMLR